MANVAKGVTVYRCSVCEYPLLTEDEVRIATFFDDGRLLPSGKFVDHKLVCKSEFDCVRRVRENVAAGPPARGGAL